MAQDYESLLSRLGPELPLLNSIPLEDIDPAAPPLVAEAVARLRRREVIREAGYDGVYGTIRLFRDGELARRTRGATLFALAPETAPAPENPPARRPVPAAQPLPSPAAQAHPERRGTVPRVNPSASRRDLLEGLDAAQRRAAEILDGPLLIVAGPGSGKTRTLTHRLAHLVAHRGVSPDGCLAVTFTRRAADEMRARLRALLPDHWAGVPIHTFHSLGLALLREHWNAAGMQRGFRVASEAERLRLLQDTLSVTERQARQLLSAISQARRGGVDEDDGAADGRDDRLAHAGERYREAMEARNWCDFDDLVIRAADALEHDSGVRVRVRRQYLWLCIDEYQDVDAQQVRLIRQLAPPDGNVCAIGDPDQAIYGFRGADVRLFTQFPEDFPGARVVRLDRNYRSNCNIVALSSQVIGPCSSAQPSTPVVDDAPNRITLHEAPSEKAEAEFVVQSLEDALGGHSFFSLDSGRANETEVHDHAFSDFAVLYRTEAQAEALAAALARSGMPFQRRSHNPLSDHPGVAALVQALEKAPASGQGSVRAQLERVCGAADPTASDAREALEMLRPLADTCGEDRSRFLSELALGSQVDTWDPRADRISLLTLHAAKGLEFPVVFIVGCEHGLPPLIWGRPKPEAPAEERRLFYVGVTRARTRLYLCRAHKRRWRGRVRAMPPSPYLADIEERLLERRRPHLPAARAHQPDDQQLDLFA